jgi:ubiquitin-activating enzyme E1
VVTVHEDRRHGLETGDWVVFEEVEGMTELNSGKPRQIKVLTPFSFAIEDTTGYKPYRGEGTFLQVKMPVTIKHVPLAQARQSLDKVLVQDEAGLCGHLNALFEGLSRFAAKHGGRLPRPDALNEASEVAGLARAFGAESKLEVNEKLVARLARAAACEISPMAAIMGGYAGQEVVKACSSKFTPLSQLFYYAAVDCLPTGDEAAAAAEFAARGSRYDDQIGVFGAKLHEMLANMRYFLVGAGAIGCEMLKNFAMMGVGTQGRGGLCVTDMDTIEKSNLNRQFLFRSGDVGKLKSVTAGEAVRAMNPALRVDSRSVRVGPDTEDVYDAAFWGGLDAVCTALDNVEARLYVDGRCVYYQKPLVDSGTLGTQGNTQVVVPFLTESYASTRDPPEESFPSCTLRHFPNRIEHTIQWARDLFEGLFKQAPEEVNAYLSSANYVAEQSRLQPGQVVENLRTIHSYLVTDMPRTFDACIVWARLLLEREFSHNIQQLLYAFPADSLTAQGTKFWSGSKRAPQPIVFDPNDPLHMSFIVAAANLRAFNYGLHGSTDVAQIKEVLRHVVVPKFEPKQVKIAATEEEAKRLKEEAADEDDTDAQIRKLCESIPPAASFAGRRLTPCEFEKDNDANFHIDFIAACSNLRARNYRIKEESKLQTKFIAGKIIPAVATTTALVTGLVCLELVKLAEKRPLEAYRCTFVNLALPLFTATEPRPCATKTVMIKGKEWKWSLWDRIDVDLGGDVPLHRLMAHMKEQYGLNVSVVSFGAAMIYFEGVMTKKKLQERLETPLRELVEKVAKVNLSERERVIPLDLSCTNEQGDDVEIPYVRFVLRK